MTLLSCALVVWALAIAAGDFARGRISNLILLMLLVPAGLALAFNQQGLLGVAPAMSLLGLGLPLLLLLPAYAWGWLGAGDVKLASVMGLVLGPWPMATVLLFAALLLGAVSWWMLAMRKQERVRGHLKNTRSPRVDRSVRPESRRRRISRGAVVSRGQTPMPMARYVPQKTGTTRHERIFEMSSGIPRRIPAAPMLATAFASVLSLAAFT
jgi:prepilin peptidase CpaA